jgi:MFS family permease
MKSEDIAPITSEDELQLSLHEEVQDVQKSIWRTNPFHLGTSTIPHYSSSTVQLTIVGIIFLCGPGVLGALTGLGGGGLGNPIAVNNSLIATYGTSAVFGFFSGPICSKLGFRMSLALGSIAYTLHTACILVYKHTQTGWLIVVSGVVLGILSSFSWTALGAMLMSYPTPEAKGKWMSLNLIYFNGGVTLGSIVSLNSNCKDGART